MSTPAEIMAILADTALAFPGYDKGKLTQAAKHYIKALTAFDKSAIQQAADALIQSSRFFPAVSEFVAACQKVQANARPNQRAAMQTGDLLREAAYALDDKRAAGLFVSDDWAALAQKFDKAGRKEAAAHLRWKAGLPFEFQPYEVEA